MITRVCQHCQQPYDTYPSIRPRYCSIACSSAAHTRGTVGACVVCGKETYSHPSRPRTYCSKSCAMHARNLTSANPALHRDISGDKNPMYGKGLTGDANGMYGRRKEAAPRWNGGRKVRKDGYTLVAAPPHHPSGQPYILEHRHVMEQHLGRYLTPDEVVHHRDANPRNNALDNLQLFASQAEHIAIAHSQQAGRHTQSES